MKPQNNCQRKEDLVTYLYGELTPSEEKNFKEHLNICSSCKKEASEFGMLRENLQTWQVEETPRVVLDLPTTQRPRSLKEILQELGSILPAWFKYGTGFAAACAASLLLLAVFNTQIRYDQNGFSFNVALFNSSNAKNIIVNPQPNDEVARAMVTKILSDKEAQINQALEEKRSQIEKELRKQIDILSGELSQKSNTELSKVSLELKRQQRSDLEKALQQIQRQRTQETFSDDDDPFNLWGGVNNKVIERAMENTQTFEQSGQ